MATEDDLKQCFLDNVLNSLYDFGDGPKKSKANKKKKRKRCQEEEEEDEEKEEMEVAATSYEGCDNENTVKDRLAGGQHKERTGINSSTAERTDPPCQQKSQVEVITFQDPQKTARARRTPAVPPKKTAPAVMETEGDLTKDDPDGLSLEKSRFEVHRFGLTGYRKEQQRGFEVERAIMLGARPPKKEYVNYKQYQQTIKDRKQKVREQESTELRRNKKSSKPREEKKKRSSAAPSGLAGRFRNGMLVLNSNEIQKIKGARGSR